ncbi:MAG: mechanosensitive ion channel family protein [Planctomycetota bacterium]
MNWQVRVWCNPADYWDVRQDLTEAAKDALDAAGISIPFPQLDVHMDKAEG